MRNITGYQLCDAHTHTGTDEELRERIDKRIRSLVCASTPSEAADLKRLASEETSLIPTYGLHPWQANRYEVAEMSAYFDSCRVIGEIGLDSVWCEVPLQIQERVFKEQLSMACDLKKPVILHTKGQEIQTARIIKNYKNTYLVHWYSAPENPLDYFPKDCYYSVGPDVLWNKNVRQVVLHVPAERLLVETDGMNAVKWAYEEAPIKKTTKKEGAEKTTPPHTISDALNAIIHESAVIKDISPDRFGKQMEKNFLLFAGL